MTSHRNKYGKKKEKHNQSYLRKFKFMLVILKFFLLRLLHVNTFVVKRKSMSTVF